MNEPTNYLPKNYEDSKAELLKNVNSAKTLNKIRKFFKFFSQKMTVIPELWQKWIELERTPTFPDFDNENHISKINQIRQKAAQHFCHEDFLFTPDYIPEQFHRSVIWPRRCLYKALWTNMNFCLSMEPLERTLTFPHPHLNMCLFDYQMFSEEPFSSSLQQIYEKNLAIYEEIKDKDITEYSYSLKDINFAIENIEWELAKQPTSKEFWNFYLQFLKENYQIKALLKVYSRYCRLFIDDANKRQEYMAFIEENNAVEEKWWIDLIEIERNFGSAKNAYEILQHCFKKCFCESEMLREYSKWFNIRYGIGNRMTKCLASIYSIFDINQNLPNFVAKTVCPENENIISLWKKDQQHFPMKKTFNNFFPSVSQYFSFPYFIMEYLYTNGTLEVKKKFHKTCKQIFLSKKTIFCHKLQILRKQKYQSPFFVKESLYLCPEDVVNNGILENLYVTNLLRVVGGNPFTCSNLMKTIKCNIKYFSIYEQLLTVNEIKMISTKRLCGLNLLSSNIFNSENVLLSFEDILALFPYPKDIRIVHYIFTENSAQKLATLHQINKIERLIINYFPFSFELESFISFLKENAADGAYIGYRFAQDVPQNYRCYFQQSVQKMLPHLDVNILEKE